jgi:(p)ppGpp synthase/HD superfamily hydrolase
LSTLETALRIAAEAHEGQTDKAGGSYVLHPIRMALSLYSPDERIVALLHDVVEDCPGWTFARIASYGFGPDIIAAIKSVTKDPQADLSDEEEYMTFIARAAANPIGRAVKLADLRDNSNLGRIPYPTDRDRARVDKYKRAIELVESATQLTKR